MLSPPVLSRASLPDELLVEGIEGDGMPLLAAVVVPGDEDDALFALVLALLLDGALALLELDELLLELDELLLELDELLLELLLEDDDVEGDEGGGVTDGVDG